MRRQGDRRSKHALTDRDVCRRRVRLTPELIEMPLQLVVGAQNGCRLPSIADEVFAAPHLVTVLDGVGHFPHLEAAEPVTKIVQQEWA